MGSVGQYFFIDGDRVKVFINSEALIIGQNQVIIHFGSKTYFQSGYDHYGNLSNLIVSSGNHSIELSHDNPTILAQWENLFMGVMYRVGFQHEYEMREKVGEGLSGVVFKASAIWTGRKVAVKVFDRRKVDSDSRQVKSIRQEMEMLRIVSGKKYFPQFLGGYITDRSYLMVYEWCQGLTLKEWVSRKIPSEQEIKHIMRQLCQALVILKQYDLVHRDIKPENIIFNLKTKCIKIVDFGFATLSIQQKHLFPNCGTPGYAAPEALDQTNTLISTLMDVFSLGVTFHFLMTGQLPYSKGCKSLLMANKEGRFIFDRRLKGKALELVGLMVCKRRHRVTIEEVLKDQFLVQNEEKSNYHTVMSPFAVNQLLSKLQNGQEVNEFALRPIPLNIRRKRLMSVQNDALKRALSRSKSKYIKRINARLMTQRF